MEGEEFVPVNADVPPSVERSLSKKTVPVEAPQSPVERRDSNASWTRKTPSRKPTAVYGFDPAEEQPQKDLSNITDANFQPRQNYQEFDASTHNTTLAEQNPVEQTTTNNGQPVQPVQPVQRAVGSETPTLVSDTLPSLPVSSIHNDPTDHNITPSKPSQVESSPPAQVGAGFSSYIRNVISGQAPATAGTSSGRFNPEAEVIRSSKDYGELGHENTGPQAYRTSSNLTISDLDVPGRYPKGF